MKCRWSSILKIENFKITDQICESHFLERDILKVYKHSLKDGSVCIVPRDRWSLVPDALPMLIINNNSVNDNIFFYILKNIICFY